VSSGAGERDELPIRPPARAAVTRLRRRSAFVSLAIGGSLLLLLLGWGLYPSQERGRPVLLVVPDGARLALDGDPVPSNGQGGTHLLRLDPGLYQLEIRLRNGTELTEELRVEEGEQALSLELRPERGRSRWTLVEVGGEAEAR